MKRCEKDEHVYDESKHNSCPYCRKSVYDQRHSDIDRFSIDHKIGEGSTAIVYSATDIRLNRKVALKFLHPDYQSNKKYKKLFKTEASYHSKLEHPNILPAYDFVEENNNVFLVLRKCNQNLKSYIKNDKVEIKNLLLILTQIASVIDYLKECNVIHRDIKPENILVDDTNNHAYLSDFGLAYDIDRLIAKREAVGTPIYMSPEMIAIDKDLSSLLFDQKEPDFYKSDLFSFGVLTYYLLSGSLPFDKFNHHKYAGTAWEKSSGLRVLRGETPIPCSDRNPDVPKIASDIISSMLTRSPHNRPDSALEAIKLIANSYYGELKYNSKIFISYSHLDFEVAQKISQGLSREGFDIWWDELIDHGTIWDDMVEEALIQSEALVTIISANSVSSKEAKHEWRYWLEYKEDNPIIPVIIDSKCRVPYRIAGLQRIYVDASIDSRIIKEVSSALLNSIKTDVKKMEEIVTKENTLKLKVDDTIYLPEKESKYTSKLDKQKTCCVVIRDKSNLGEGSKASSKFSFVVSKYIHNLSSTITILQSNSVD